MSNKLQADAIRESKMETCPFCGSQVKLDVDGFYMFCCDNCGAGITFAKVFEDGTAGDCNKDESISKWNRRAQPDHCGDAAGMVGNAPLTLDELRGMDREPVYCVGETRFGVPFEGWKVLEKYNQSPGVIRFTDGSAWVNEKYGVALFAYRRKPEPEGSE